MNLFSFRGLRSLLKRFDEGIELSVAGTHWSIAQGGYDLWWQIYFDEIPVVDCVNGEIENDCLDNKTFTKLKKIVLSEYSWLKKYNR